jgi:hypothetical protein
VGTAIVLLGNEPLVPAEDRVGGHDAGDLAEALAAHGLALGGEAPTLSVGETKTTPSELLAEYTVLLLEVGDDILLLPGDPPSKGQQEKLQGTGWGEHEDKSGPRARSGARDPQRTRDRCQDRRSERLNAAM